VFQGQGMVLKGRVHIGLGGMTGVPGFGEEAEIGQLKPPHHGRCSRDVRCVPSTQVRSVSKGCRQEDGLDAQVQEEQG
jgi:hypothetical protein